MIKVKDMMDCDTLIKRSNLDGSKCQKRYQFGEELGLELALSQVIVDHQ